MEKGARVVFIPFPVVGHMVSAMEFVKLLINRDERLWITVLVMKRPLLDTINIVHTQQRLQVIDLPESPTSSNSESMMDLLEQQKPYVKKVISDLIASDSVPPPESIQGSPSPPLAAFVVDMFCTTMIDVADHFKVPSLVFSTSGISFLGLIHHLHSLREDQNTHFSESELVIPTFSNPVPPTSLPSIVLNKEWDPFFLTFGKGLKKAHAIIVNSFEELESHATAAFNTCFSQPIYPIGPILNPKAHVNTNTDILKWLDTQPPSSVVFLCFGSMGSFGQDQTKEIACALENSGARFLWSLRKPPLEAKFMTPPSDYSPSDLIQILPSGFLDRTTGIGKLVGWAPQAQILAHPAIGGFVSHCGWNSTLESIYFDVPIVTWPLYAEQQTNAFLLVRELNMAIELALDYRVDFKFGPNAFLSADKIEKGIRSVLNIDQDTRKRVKEMSQKSKETLLEGGCSYSYLGHLIDYIMSQVSI